MKSLKFKLEEFWNKYEFEVPHLLGCSDSESYTLEQILDLGSNDEIDLWNKLKLSYTSVSGLNELRHQIAKSMYPSLHESNIICFAGAGEGIFSILSAICKSNKNALVVTPCYQSLFDIPRTRGCSVTEIKLTEENNWKLDIEEIEKNIKPNTEVLILNYPHNPTGQMLSQEELDKIVDICRKNDLWLFNDEVYMYSGNPSKPWPKPVAEIYEKGISLGCLSKALGLPGLRIGWAACKQTNVLASFARIKHYLSICNSGPSEILGLIALRNKDVLLERNNAIIANNMNIFDKFMLDHQDFFSWVRPEATSIGMVRYNNPKESTDALSKRVAIKMGVLLLPASVFDYGKSHFRIGLGKKDFPESIARLALFMKKHR